MKHMGIALLVALLATQPACKKSSEDDGLTMLTLTMLLTGRVALPACGTYGMANYLKDYSTGSPQIVAYSVATPSVLLSSVPYAVAGCRPSAYSNTSAQSGTFAYNIDGLITAMTGSYQYVYAYNSKGYPTGLTYSGNNISFTYDSMGRVYQQLTNGVAAFTLTYSGSTVTYASSTTTTTDTYTIDSSGRVTQDNVLCTGASGCPVGTGATATITYTYDSAGRVTQTSCVGGATNYCTANYTITYTYDSGGRLTGVDKSGTTTGDATYTYNASGQVTQSAVNLGSLVTTTFTN
ncbi:MAG: hypothetical protein HY042_09195 [Spirochaetia bacterium]|nr:hypothetical protein [Spirochaetia bacterium]